MAHGKTLDSGYPTRCRRLPRTHGFCTGTGKVAGGDVRSGTWGIVTVWVGQGLS